LGYQYFVSASSAHEQVPTRIVAAMPPGYESGALRPRSRDSASAYVAT
jgi:hypothetical protein